MGQNAVSEEGRPDAMTFPRRLDVAKVSVYGLSILCAGLFLFLPFVNLLHPSLWQRWMGTIHGVGSFETSAWHDIFSPI
jgi:hypothetical protein